MVVFSIHGIQVRHIPAFWGIKAKLKMGSNFDMSSGFGLKNKQNLNGLGIIEDRHSKF
jgi:hypothetical protein